MSSAGLSALRSKVVTWIATITSPSATHASGMLILFALLAATADAQVADVQKHVHQGNTKVPSSTLHVTPGEGASAKGDSETPPASQQDMLYYVAMGMLVSQGLIRLLTWLSARREKATAAEARKSNGGSPVEGAHSNINGGLTLDAFNALDEDSLLKRKQDLATLEETASLLSSDSDDEDYEESEEEEDEEEISDEDNVEESDSEDEVEMQEEELLQQLVLGKILKSDATSECVDLFFKYKKCLL
ncbi:hypothetical protein BGZ94_001927, partial [Podila epigama]